ncbi:T7SS effector LXG polymorphic toxin [Gracilibacillus saliphilus]|uniref:T7SS effector LXG polymorphic toxin n=1 Tax=Gracilibacillus saliphilus TaxID=543890 RepID=UPI0013D658DA|nr:T7SS effector LXG polymorphic toxin [Gracilibacillus saliphilus]
MPSSKISVSEARSFYQEFRNISKTTYEALEQLEVNINETLHMESFKGKAAEDAKQYFNILHQTLLQAFRGIFEQLETNVAKHLQDFQEEIDANEQALILDAYLKTHQEDVMNNHQQLEELTTDVYSIISSVSDLTNAIIPSTSILHETRESSTQVIQKLSNRMESFSTAYSHDHQQIQSVLQETKSLLNKVENTSNKTSSLTTFKDTLPEVKSYIADSKENNFFNWMLLTKEERTRKLILKSRGSLDLEKKEGLQKFEKQSSSNELFEPVTKSLNSFKEIGLSIYDGLEKRNEKKLDSGYDFVNYLTLGLPSGFANLYDGMEARYQNARNSFNTSNFLSYISMGTSDMISGAVNPDEVYSAEHWLNSFGLATLISGGGILNNTLNNKTILNGKINNNNINTK